MDYNRKRIAGGKRKLVDSSVAPSLYYSLYQLASFCKCGVFSFESLPREKDSSAEPVVYCDHAISDVRVLL
jgi:hypothetical protein